MNPQERYEIGEEIARQSSGLVKYEGPQYMSNLFIMHLFTHIETGSTFGANTLLEVVARSEEISQKFALARKSSLAVHII
jgi:hypothetical protein